MAIRHTSAKVEGCLTARLIGRAETKVGLSDPVIPYGRVIAHQIKGTLGITGLSLPSVHSGGAVWHLNKSGCCRSNPVPTNRLITVNPSAKLMAGSFTRLQCFRPAIPWEVFCQHTCDFELVSQGTSTGSARISTAFRRQAISYSELIE